MSNENNEPKIIIRRSKHDKEHPFLMINKKLIRDSELSIKNRGILIYLLSFPDNWKFIFRKIIDDLGIGINQFYKSLKEIIKLGYAKREFLRDKKGRIIDKIYEFSEDKVFLIHCEPFHQNSETDKSLETEISKPPHNDYQPFHSFPLMDNHKMDFDDTTNKDSLLNTEKEQQQEKRAAVVFSCLENLGIPQEDKIWLTKNYPEEEVIYAVKWSTHPLTKITSTLQQVIKWACKGKPQMPKDKEDISNYSRELAYYAESNLVSSFYTVESAPKFVRISPKTTGTEYVINYDAPNFKVIFLHELHDRGFRKVA